MGGSPENGMEIMGYVADILVLANATSLCGCEINPPQLFIYLIHPSSKELRIAYIVLPLVLSTQENWVFPSKPKPEIS